MISTENITKKQLLDLKFDGYIESVRQEVLLIIPTKIKHESGYAKMKVIGVFMDNIRLCAEPDSITWSFKIDDKSVDARIINDMDLISGAYRYSSKIYDFLLEWSEYSLNIQIVPKLYNGVRVTEMKPKYLDIQKMYNI
jgi:hypothetical protein